MARKQKIGKIIRKYLHLIVQFDALLSTSSTDHVPIITVLQYKMSKKKILIKVREAWWHIGMSLPQSLIPWACNRALNPRQEQ